jgi:uncharacterized membrane protein YkvA (DUF1232 family)
MLIPDFLKLLLRMFKDSRVSTADKALLIGTIVYAITPLDILPDFIPFVGQIDDIYLIAIGLLRMLNRTPDEVIQEHWDNAGNLPAMVNRISRAAQYFLPRRIRHMLLGRAEIGRPGREPILTSPAEPESINDRRRRKLK